MKVFLVSPSIEEKHRAKPDADGHYPLGLAYVHSYARKCGHDVKTFFANNHEPETCLKAVDRVITEWEPDVVGVQIISHNRTAAFQVIERVHELAPATRIVLGGIHVSIMYEQILQRFPFVIVVIGEGELTFVELLTAVENGGALSRVNGLAYINDGTVYATPRRELIADLDSLPFMEHESFFSEKRKVANLLTSRGCPFNCSFCVLEHISRRKVRYRSPKNVVDEIEWLVKDHPQLETVWIHDDAFFLDNKRAIEICREIQSRDIHLNFICSARFKPISEELVNELEKAGFTKVLFGLESGSDQILKSCHKGITKNDVREAVRLFTDKKIDLVAFLIVGLPGETEETILETAEFIQEIQSINYMYYEDVGVCMIYPGTEVYTIAKEKGLIDDNFWMTDGAVPFYTGDHSEEELFQLKMELQKRISFGFMRTCECIEYQKKLLPNIIRHVFKFRVTSMQNFFLKVMTENGILADFIECAFDGDLEPVIQRLSLESVRVLKGKCQ